MAENRVLIVEDERDVRDLIALHLKREGYELVCAGDGEEALGYLDSQEFGLVVLDWMLPGRSGLEICKQLSGKTPILMVTARADPSDVVLGLETGAWDYVIKPFDIDVLLARVRAILRRMASSEPSEELRVGDLSLNCATHQVKCGSTEIHLTVSEFKLLSALLKQRGVVLTRDRLIDLVQGEGVTVIDRAIDTHIFGVRKKLGCCSDLIETIRGVGYRIRGEC